MGECCGGIFFCKNPEAKLRGTVAFYLATAYTAYLHI